MENVSANQKVTIKYSDGLNAPKERKDDTRLFVASAEAAALVFEHRENGYNDFNLEPLLPHKTSNFGPGVAVADVNGDGLQDVYFGGASGQVGSALYPKQ